MRVEFLLEEPSMKDCLEQLLPKILPEQYVLNENVFLRPHQGKQDLQKSIPKKVQAFSYFADPVVIIVMHDQDSNDCMKLKNKLSSFFENYPYPYLVRIVCIELEAWYIGDMDAIENVYSNFKAKKYKNVSKFRKPDSCNAADELKKIIPAFKKGHAARNIPRYFNIERNNSESFRQFISGLKRVLQNQ